MNRFNPYGNAGPRGSGSGYSIFASGGYGQQVYKPKAPRQESKKCATHGKKRTLKNLSKNDDGEWVCKTGFECRDASAKTDSETNTGETGTCVLHGKTRTVANLGKNHKGEWVCLGSSLCKTGGAESGRQSLYQPGPAGMFNGQFHGGWMPRNGMYGGGPFCSLHGKKRTQRNLTMNPAGEWVCIPGSRCKVVGGEGAKSGGGGHEVCSVHGKSRSSQNLEQNEDGEWVCMENSTCK